MTNQTLGNQLAQCSLAWRSQMALLLSPSYLQSQLPYWPYIPADLTKCQAQKLFENHEQCFQLNNWKLISIAMNFCLLWRQAALIPQPALVNKSKQILFPSRALYFTQLMVSPHIVWWNDIVCPWSEKKPLTYNQYFFAQTYHFFCELAPNKPVSVSAWNTNWWPFNLVKVFTWWNALNMVKNVAFRQSEC